MKEHALKLRADGSIWCGSMQVQLPGSGDERLLRFHLAEIARCMPQLELADPRLPPLPDGRLEIRVEDRAPVAGLQRVLGLCADPDVLIRQLSLALVHDGRAGLAIPFDLPLDSAAASDGAGSLEPLEIGLHALGEGDARKVEYDARATVARVAGPGGERAPLREGRTTTELESLAAFLREQARDHPDRRVVIDPQPGVVYAEVSALLDVVRDAGFRSITFVGRRER